MPTYFFNVRQNGSLIEDEEGIDLPDLDTAKTEAMGGAMDIVADRTRSGSPMGLDDTFEVTDEDGEVLLTVPFREAVPQN
jgi:hypothetical protein